MMAEHADLLERHGIDYADALERFCGNEALYERLACKYLDDAHFDALAAALDEGDAERAYQEAHALKGVAGNLSFSALYRAVSEISEILRAGEIEQARALFPAVRTAHESATDALRQLSEPAENTRA